MVLRRDGTAGFSFARIFYSVVESRVTLAERHKMLINITAATTTREKQLARPVSLFHVHQESEESCNLAQRVSVDTVLTV